MTENGWIVFVTALWKAGFMIGDTRGFFEALIIKWQIRNTLITEFKNERELKGLEDSQHTHVVKNVYAQKRMPRWGLLNFG